MSIEEAINRLCNARPVLKEDEETFRIAVDCMRFTADFLPLEATPERMKHALNLLNSIEYVAGNIMIKAGDNCGCTVGD